MGVAADAGVPPADRVLDGIEMFVQPFRSLGMLPQEVNRESFDAFARSDRFGRARDVVGG